MPVDVVEISPWRQELARKLGFDPIDPSKSDLKEEVLKRVYGVQITPAQVAAEAQRINATTRAPDVLAELKTALGNDPERFARTVVKPILVERELRQRFDNDDHLHALEVRARLQHREARERRRHEVLLVVDRHEDGECQDGRLLATKVDSEAKPYMIPQPDHRG